MNTKSLLEKVRFALNSTISNLDAILDSFEKKDRSEKDLMMERLVDISHATLQNELIDLHSHIVEVDTTEALKQKVKYLEDDLRFQKEENARLRHRVQKLAESSIDPKQLLPDEIALLNKGLKIDAIKLVRERTLLGLKESKDLVEAFLKENNIAHWPNSI